ncbi:MAG: hypothetical protein FJ128_01245 [Deltaproteobacteria bacterium]|nr:hypothetical protein [Deltaproteobacteria bacterium]
MRSKRILIALCLISLVFSGVAVAKVKFYGYVEMVPQYGVYGIWIIGGRSVLVTAETKMKYKKGPIGPGAYVQVEGRYYGSQFVATEIEPKRPK